MIDRHLGSCDDEGENGDEHFFKGGVKKPEC